MIDKKTIKIPRSNKYLFEQNIEIPYSKKEVKILVGLGMLNSNNELSIDLPLDILIVIESLKSLKSLLILENISLYITIWIGDKNAEILLKEKNLFTEKNKELWSSTKKLYCEKIYKLMKKNGFAQENWDFFFGSDLYEEDEYQSHCKMISENVKFLQNTTSYSKEQLLVMNYFKKKKDYDFRLSWKKKDKTNRNYNDRDEKGMDDEYLETFKEEPLVSIYYHNGFKLSDDEGGLGVAVPYSYFPSEINKRIPLNQNISLDEIEDFFLNLSEKNEKKFQEIFGNGKNSEESLPEFIFHKIALLLK